MNQNKLRHMDLASLDLTEACFLPGRSFVYYQTYEHDILKKE